MKKSLLKPLLWTLLVLGLAGVLGSQIQFRTVNPEESVLRNSLGQPKSLDPVNASDYASCVAVLSLYDTLFQYDYLARPYKTVPSMLDTEPVVSPDGLTWSFTLRDDLYFVPDACFANDTERKVTSEDVLYSLRRLADARQASSGYWLVRGKIKGIDAWREKTAALPLSDTAVADLPCDGLEKIDARRFSLHLTAPDPRLRYTLAMAYTGIVSRKAAEVYGGKLDEHPVGSGPFKLFSYQRDYRIEFERYPQYRFQTFPEAENPADRSRPLPLLDRIICYLVQDPQPAWLMFLNGDLDLNAVDKDRMDAVGTGGQLPEEFTRKGIRLLTSPEHLIYYVGFSFTDPRLAKNLHLRRALTLAYNIDLRCEFYNGLITRAEGPLPPGVGGALPDTNPWNRYNIETAKAELVKAGYPGGIDPETGEPLQFTFDLPETGPAARQTAEMMIRDMSKIGVVITPSLNSKPKFFEKNRAGQLQLFRFNWIADYPDAQNFFQLFHSANAGGSNRSFYTDKVFDALYEETLLMPDGPARTSRYEEMSRYLINQCPWIFESHPLSYRLIQPWLENYCEHDYAFDRWKYLSKRRTKR